MDFKEFVRPELLILVPVLYLIGFSMKQSKMCKDEKIPIILMVVGIILSTLYIASKEPYSLDMVFVGVTQGVLVAGASVLGNQIYKQSQKK